MENYKYNTMQIKCESPQEILCLFQFFKAHGIYISKGRIDTEDIEELANYYWNSKWHWIILYPKGNLSVGGNDRAMEYNDTVDFCEILDYFRQEQKIITVVLNEEYKAEVSKQGIRINKHLFPLSIIDELQKAKNAVT